MTCRLYQQILGRFSIFALSEFVDNTVEGGHDMHLFKDDVGLSSFY